MTSQTLSSIALQTVENYRNAATRAVVAYRLGGKRLVRIVNGALTDSVYPRTAKLAPRATERMNQVRGTLSGAIVKGVDQVAERTSQAIDFSSTTAAAQVTKIADFAAAIDNKHVANGLQTAARLTLPGAKVALVVSNKFAQGATALADAAGDRPLHGATRKVTAGAKRKVAPVARKAHATVKTATQRLAKFGKGAAA